jgi:hypothetical protein
MNNGISNVLLAKVSSIISNSWIFLDLFAGLFFIESNIAAATDEKQLSPIGFDIIFLAMIEYAKNLDLNIPLGATNLEALVHKGELELKTYSYNSVLVSN